MKVAMLYGIRDLRIEDIEMPQIGAKEVLVKIKAATTCGTDVKIFRRGYVKKIIKLPTVFGHEWAGKVVDVGEGLEWPKKGMRVRAGNSAPCFRCLMCRKGKYNLCENMIWLWGAYAEYIKVPTRMVQINMQEIPQNTSYEEASITEPLACVLHGIEKANIKLGDVVVIRGAGSIGLLHLLVAKKRGADKIIIIDRADERLNFAKKLGANKTINPNKEDAIKIVKQFTGGGGDVVIEAVGMPETWEQCLKFVKKGGTVLEFGGCPPGTNISVDAELLHYSEVNLLSSFHATPLHFRKAFELIKSRVIDVRPFVTKKMKLEKIKEAFEILTTPGGEIKIAIIP